MSPQKGNYVWRWWVSELPVWWDMWVGSLEGNSTSIFQRVLFEPYWMVYRHPLSSIQHPWKVQVGCADRKPASSKIPPFRSHPTQRPNQPTLQNGRWKPPAPKTWFLHLVNGEFAREKSVTPMNLPTKRRDIYLHIYQKWYIFLHLPQTFQTWMCLFKVHFFNFRWEFVSIFKHHYFLELLPIIQLNPSRRGIFWKCVINCCIFGLTSTSKKTFFLATSQQKSGIIPFYSVWNPQQ